MIQPDRIFTVRNQDILHILFCTVGRARLFHDTVEDAMRREFHHSREVIAGWRAHVERLRLTLHPVRTTLQEHRDRLQNSLGRSTKDALSFVGLQTSCALEILRTETSPVEAIYSSLGLVHESAELLLRWQQDYLWLAGTVSVAFEHSSDTTSQAETWLQQAMSAFERAIDERQQIACCRESRNALLSLCYAASVHAQMLTKHRGDVLKLHQRALEIMSSGQERDSVSHRFETLTNLTTETLDQRCLLATVA